MGSSISGTLVGGQKDREWKEHKYTSRHRNKNGKWVYDTNFPEEPMEEEKASSGSSSISGGISNNKDEEGEMGVEDIDTKAISNKKDDEGEMGVEDIDTKVGNTISKGANWISGSISLAKASSVSSLPSNDNTEMGEEYISSFLKRT